MRWYHALLGLVGLAPRAAASQGTAALTPMSPELIKWFGQPTSSGKSVTDESSMRVAAVWACRRIISECISMMPWSMYRRTSDRNSEQADDHWLQDVLVYTPNADMTDAEFRETMTMDLTGEGNTYSLKEQLGKRVTSLYPMPACHVKLMRRANGVVTREPSIAEGEVFFRFNDRGRTVDYPRDKVWHVKGFGNGLVGLSPIAAVREGIGGALAMEEFSNRFFSQGGMPAGTLSYPGWLTPEQREVAREALTRLLGGLGKAHQFALFEGGVKPEPWTPANMEDMQFILGRKFSVLEICRIFRVPPHMVAELEKGASYASIEQMSMDFVQFTLLPYLNRFERSVTKWLLPLEERRKYFLRFNYEVLLRADSKGRAEFLSIMVNNGMMTRNEARAKENLNKSTDKNMDAFTVQTALAPIEKLGEQPKPQPGGPGFPKRREEEEDAPPKKDAAHSTTVQVAAVMPERMAHEVNHYNPELNEIAVKFANGQAALANQFDASFRALLAEFSAQHSALVVRQGAIADKLDQLAKQERTIVTEDGETFVSKPVTH